MIDVIFQLLIFFVLTLKFHEAEGRLFTQLPKRGPGPGSGREEVRIFLCCSDRDPGAHGAGPRHEADLLREEQSDLARTGGCPAGRHLVLNDVCIALVERNPAARLYRTRACAAHREEASLLPAARAAENRRRYREVAASARGLRDRISPPPAVVIETDRAVPYEHVLGVVNALKEAGIEGIEFAAPR
ncbi:MAG: biopolymer transporter ExbD [Planctomycetes bacterium]|nr:biopolymer transporter ExbD [Planctomycetota bacterium]